MIPIIPIAVAVIGALAGALAGQKIVDKNIGGLGDTQKNLSKDINETKKNYYK